MPHIILAIITMSVVWFAWQSFKKLGRIRLADTDLTPEERSRIQFSVAMRIVACLLLLAILPFLFTILTAS